MSFSAWCLDYVIKNVAFARNISFHLQQGAGLHFPEVKQTVFTLFDFFPYSVFVDLARAQGFL